MVELNELERHWTNETEGALSPKERRGSERSMQRRLVSLRGDKDRK